MSEKHYLVTSKTNHMTEESTLLDQGYAKTADFKDFSFPLSFSFKISSFSNDFVARDAGGHTIAYVRQKMFKLKESIMVYAEESKINLLYKIDADRIIDFNASYAFTDGDGQLLGRIGRKGMRSLWNASYDIFHDGHTPEFTIREENPMAKVGDAILGEIPILGIFTGYLFNPKYLIEDKDGKPVARLSKKPSFFGKEFTVDKLADFAPGASERILLGVMMMVLLERRRG